MSYMDRFKTFSIRIGKKTYTNLKYKDWSIEHTFNTKTFTFSQFVQAYISKQDTNGFSVSMDIYFDGINSDVNAEEFRKSLTSRDVCHIMLPLGQGVEQAMHCLSLSEKWDLAESLGVVVFSVSFHTTIVDINLPLGSLAAVNTIEVGDLEVKYELDRTLAYNNGVDTLSNIKSAVRELNQAFIDVYQLEVDFLADAKNNSSFIDQIKTSTLSNWDLISKTFNSILDLPKENTTSLAKNSAFYDYIFSTDQFDGDPDGYQFYGASVLRARANSTTLFQSSDITRRDLYNEIDALNKQNKEYLAKVYSNVYIGSTWSPSVDLLNSLSYLISSTANNLQNIAFSSKVENSVFINEYTDHMSFISKYYPELKTIEEYEEKLEELIRINNFRGNYTFGILPETQVKYLI